MEDGDGSSLLTIDSKPCGEVLEKLGSGFWMIYYLHEASEAIVSEMNSKIS